MELMVEEYKQTEVGLIPVDWDVKTLLECCIKITDGTHDSPRPVKTGIPFLTAIHVKENNIDFEGCYYLPKAIHNLIFSRCNPELEDVLMVNIGSGVATSALVEVDYEFSLKNVALLKPNKKLLKGSYLNYWQSTTKSKITSSISTGGAQPFLSLKQIGDLRIALPTIAEQTAIATALSDADALISSLEKLIAKKRNIKQGAMQKLLEPKEGWEVKKLGELITYRNGKSYESLIVDDGEYNLITLNSINIKGKLKPEHLRVKVSDNSLEKGDLIMVLSDVAHGNFLGLTDVVPNDKYVLNQRMGALKRVTGVVPKFLSLYINYCQSYFKMSGKGSSQQNLGKDDILKFEINVPSMDEQFQIALIITDIEVEIETLETKLEKYRNVKLGMMQNLLTGKIRLV